MPANRHTRQPISQPIGDYAQLRRRAEQCRAEEMARLLALARKALRAWRARTAARRTASTGPATTAGTC